MYAGDDSEWQTLDCGGKRERVKSFAFKFLSSC